MINLEDYREMVDPVDPVFHCTLSPSRARAGRDIIMEV